jgi:hypothetical protein
VQAILVFTILLRCGHCDAPVVVTRATATSSEEPRSVRRSMHAAISTCP